MSRSGRDVNEAVAAKFPFGLVFKGNGDATMFEARFQVAWGDVDYNRHLANTAYLDYAAQTRFLQLAAAGFGPDAFAQHGIGPAVMKDEISYRRELKLLDHFTVQFLSGGANADRSRFILVNRFLNAEGKLCAELRSLGTWMDLAARRSVAPPPGLLAAMDSLQRTEDWADL
jgi:acyl-CoA thioester hydrolase